MPVGAFRYTAAPGRRQRRRNGEGGIRRAHRRRRSRTCWDTGNGVCEAERVGGGQFVISGTTYARPDLDDFLGCCYSAESPEQARRQR